MPFAVARRLVIPLIGAPLGCALLFLLSISSSFTCCATDINFPFFCLGLLFVIFSILSFFRRSTLQKGQSIFWYVASSPRVQHFVTLMFPEYLAGRFFVSLLVCTVLILTGAALLFSLSSGFAWSILALGCLCILLGPGILLLGLRRP